jgi:hypothetical protein
VRLTVRLLKADIAMLQSLGRGSLSEGITRAIQHVVKTDPTLIPKMDIAAPSVFAPAPTSAPAANRATRDALIYHECLARTFTRAEIAKRYALSAIRVHQIYAKQAKNPPPFPATYSYASSADPATTHRIINGVPRTADPKDDPALSSIADLISQWL